jgi:hypothetical protein
MVAVTVYAGVEAPLVSDATVGQVTTLPTAEYVPPPLAVTPVAPGGRVSLTTTPVAVLGPAFVAWTVHVVVVPAVSTAGPVLVTDTSAAATMVVVVVCRSFAAVGSAPDPRTRARFTQAPVAVAGIVAVTV